MKTGFKFEIQICFWLQVFDRQGDFLFRIGSVGKHDGALVYPNRVAVCRLTGNVVITERSPTHQVLNGAYFCIVYVAVFAVHFVNYLNYRFVRL